MKKVAAVLLVCVAGVACSKSQSEPTPTATMSATPSGSGGSSGAAAAPAANGLTWDAPVGWVVTPNPSPMRKATYKVGDTEATVTTAGGTVESNWKRWQDQFGGATPKIEKKKVNNLDVTVVELKGAFNGGMMGGKPGPGQMMLGAIVETMPDLTFIKLVGSEETVTKNREAFDKLIASVRMK